MELAPSGALRLLHHQRNKLLLIHVLQPVRLRLRREQWLTERTKKKRWLVVTVVSVAVVALVIVAVAATRGGTKIDPTKLAKVEQGDLTKSVVATGKVTPITKVEIKSKASGIVKKLYVDYRRSGEAGPGAGRAGQGRDRGAGEFGAGAIAVVGGQPAERRGGRKARRSGRPGRGHSNLAAGL